MTRDILTRIERDAMASHTCDLCGALLLLVEIGPHYRAEHPDDAPRVTARGTDGRRARSDYLTRY